MPTSESYFVRFHPQDFKQEKGCRQLFRTRRVRTSKWKMHTDNENMWKIIYQIQSTLDISKLKGLFITSSNYPKCKSIQRQIMVGEINKNIFLIQIYASKFRRIRDIRVRDIESRL